MTLLYQFLQKSFSGKITCFESTSYNDLTPFVETLLFFSMVYLLSGFGNRTPELLTVILYGSFAIRVAFTYDRSFILLLAVLLGCGGMLGEGLMTKCDLVQYRQPEIFGVPYWLGGLYVHGAFCLREGMRHFVYDGNESSRS